MGTLQDLMLTLAKQGTVRTFKKSSVLLYQGEAPRMAYIIKSGVIKAYTINNAGEEKIVTLHTPYDMFPTPWIFDKSSTTQFYYEAATNCEILTIERPVLRSAIMSPQQLPVVLQYFINNYTGLLMRVTALEQSRASEKIMFTLYYLLFRYGREVKPGKYQVDVPLTHNATASLVGLTRETTTHELNRLKKLGAIQYSHQIYTVDKERLERLLGEDSFEDIKL